MEFYKNIKLRALCIINRYEKTNFCQIVTRTTCQIFFFIIDFEIQKLSNYFGYTIDIKRRRCGMITNGTTIHQS